MPRLKDHGVDEHLSLKDRPDALSYLLIELRALKQKKEKELAC